MGILAAECVQLEQGFNATLLTLAYVLTQGFHRPGFGRRFGFDAAPAGGAVQQQFGNQPLAAVPAGQALRLLVVDQPLQGWAGVLQQ